MFKNDERYWDINLLNKWFAVSSIIFLAVTVWVFVDDNDDEFKTYQKEFRKMQIQIAEEKLVQDSTEIASDKVLYEQELAVATEIFNERKEDLELLEKELRTLKNRHYNENMLYQGQKAQIDALKFLVEADNAHGSSHGPSHLDEYNAALDKLDNLRLIREGTEIEISEKEQAIKQIKSQVKAKKR